MHVQTLIACLMRLAAICAMKHYAICNIYKLCNENTVEPPLIKRSHKMQSLGNDCILKMLVLQVKLVIVSYVTVL